MTSSGLLAWGQAGTYNAIDDREIITALAGGRSGLMSQPEVSAGSGLAINIAGGWWAVVPCGDGTSAVIGSRSQQTVTSAAQGTGSRTDYWWADVDPAAATWTITRLTSAPAPTRPGILLFTATVPANASTAAAQTFSPEPARFPLSKGVIAAVSWTDGTKNRSATDFAGAANQGITPWVDVDRGRWYRLSYRTPDAAFSAMPTMNVTNAVLFTGFAYQTTVGGAWQQMGPTHSWGMRQGLTLRQTLMAEHTLTGLPRASYRFGISVWGLSGASAQFGTNYYDLASSLTVEDMGPGPGYTSPGT